MPEVRLMAIVAAALLLVACSSNEKKEPPAYFFAEEGVPLKVPADVSRPDFSHTLQIPHANQSLGEYDPGLVEPPDLVSHLPLVDVEEEEEK